MRVLICGGLLVAAFPVSLLGAVHRRFRVLKRRFCREDLRVKVGFQLRLFVVVRFLRLFQRTQGGVLRFLRLLHGVGSRVQLGIQALLEGFSGVLVRLLRRFDRLTA